MKMHTLTSHLISLGDMSLLRHTSGEGLDLHVH